MKPGKLTSFPQRVKLKADEIVVFSWIVYKSRKHGDSVNAKVMKDSRIAGMDLKSMLFDGKRMFWGGFKSFVELHISADAFAVVSACDRLGLRRDTSSRQPVNTRCDCDRFAWHREGRHRLPW